MKHLFISLVLFLCGATAHAAVGDTFSQNGVTYIVTTDNTVSIYEVSSELTECTIEASVTNGDVTYSVTAIDRDAFYWSNVTKITLPNTITGIGYGAFRSSPLESITIPSSVKTIGAYAFYKTNITSIEVPEGVTVLENATFSQCYSLENVKLPSTLEKICQAAFYKSKIAKIEIPAACKQIDAYAFEGCANLTEVNMPDAITEFTIGIFQDCEKLEKINLPEGLTTIKTMAFQGCALPSIHIPASVTTIEANAFNDVPLATITLDEKNETFTIIDGVLYTKDKRFIYLYPRITDSKKYAIIDGCVAVYGGAFYGCDIKTVTFPQGFLGIDSYGFCYSDLETVELPNSIEIIFEQAFAGTKLSQITIPESVTELSDAVLASCPNLKKVTLPAGLTDIGNRAFFQSSALETIYCTGAKPAEFNAWETYTNPFYGVDCSKVTVKCPKESLSEYQASEWSDFGFNIEGIDYSGVNSLTSNDIIINAGSNAITITLNCEGVTKIALITLDGKNIYNQISNEKDITITNLSQGAYILSIEVNGAHITKKVVLN